MQDESKVILGVCKSLEGLRDIIESLPEDGNVDIWQAIGQAEQIAKQRIAKEHRT